MERKAIIIAMFITLLFSLSGCEIVGTIFKTGMGVGVIIVVLILALVLYIVRKRNV